MRDYSYEKSIQAMFWNTLSLEKRQEILNEVFRTPRIAQSHENALYKDLPLSVKRFLIAEILTFLRGAVAQ